MAKNDKDEAPETEAANALAQLNAEEAAMAKAAEDASSNKGLVEMRKGDETSHVHPTAVKDHQIAGWTHA